MHGPRAPVFAAEGALADSAHEVTTMSLQAAKCQDGRRPFEICDEIEGMDANQASLQVLMGLLAHRDPAVRGSVLEKIMDAFPKQEASRALRMWIKSEPEPSLQIILNDFLAEA